jgi:hypothetical protein
MAWFSTLFKRNTSGSKRVSFQEPLLCVIRTVAEDKNIPYEITAVCNEMEDDVETVQLSDSEGSDSLGPDDSFPQPTPLRRLPWNTKTRSLMAPLTKIPVAIVGFLLFDYIISAPTWLFLVIGMMGGWLFTHAKMRTRHKLTMRPFRSL